MHKEVNILKTKIEITMLHDYKSYKAGCTYQVDQGFFQFLKENNLLDDIQEKMREKKMKEEQLRKEAEIAATAARKAEELKQNKLSRIIRDITDNCPHFIYLNMSRPTVNNPLILSIDTVIKELNKLYPEAEGEISRDFLGKIDVRSDYITCSPKDIPYFYIKFFGK